METSLATAALAGRTIVIIGGTTGLGWSAALACRAAGARLVVVGRNAEHVVQAQQSLGEPHVAFVGDATDPQTAEAAVQTAVERFGRLDGLYHVAGGSGRSWGDGPLDAIPDDGWSATLRLNLDSVFYSNRAAVRQFLAQDKATGNHHGGSILNMASVLGYSPSPKLFATHAYGTAKAAILGLTKTCAAYYAPANIRFNAVAPALVETPMSRRAATDERTLQYIAQKQPLDGGRIGHPTDLDAAVVYFLSDQSRFTTGQTLAIDGGWTVSEA